MSMSKNLGAYTDIIGVLAEATEAGGATLRLKTHGKARHWIQRAYYLRRLLHERQGHSEYDGMKLSLKGEQVTIRFNVIDGVLRDKDGRVIEATAQRIELEISEEDQEVMEGGRRGLGRGVGGFLRGRRGFALAEERGGVLQGDPPRGLMQGDTPRFLAALGRARNVPI